MQAVSLVSGHEPPPSTCHLISQSVADKRANTVVVGAEAAELDFLGVLDLLSIAVTPFHRDIRVSIGVDEDVESAIAIENGEEGDGGSNLAENGLNLFLNLLLRLFNGLGGGAVAVSVAFQPTSVSIAAQRLRMNRKGQVQIYPGAAFSLSPALRELWLFELLPKISTSNCQRSTCSPVSLSVMTTTSFEIFPPAIHLFSCDMIFLIYALTWSSADTIIRLDWNGKGTGRPKAVCRLLRKEETHRAC